MAPWNISIDSKIWIFKKKENHGSKNCLLKGSLGNQKWFFYGRGGERWSWRAGVPAELQP